MGVPGFASRPAPRHDGPQPVTEMSTTCEGVWLLQALCGIETLPDFLILRPYVSAQGQPTAHPGLKVLRTAGALLGDDVHPTIVQWLTVLGGPDIQCVASVRRGEDYLRAVLARRGRSHAALSRCEDDVKIEHVAAVTSPRDLVGRLLGLCKSQAEPARFDPITVPTARLLDGMAEVVRGLHSASAALAPLGLSVEQRRILMMAADSPEMELSMALVQRHGSGEHVSKAAVTVTDSAAGRVVTSPIRGDDGLWWTQVEPGTLDAIGRGMGRLISTMPNPSWSGDAQT